MNLIAIAGNVGKDAQTRTTQTGDVVASFSVAVNEGKDRTTWFDCSIWGDRADKLAPYITKGSKIAVSGSVSARVHEGKAYLQIRVSQVTFQSSKADRIQGDAPRQEETRSSGGRQAIGYSGTRGDLDDEIPF